MLLMFLVLIRLLASDAQQTELTQLLLQLNAEYKISLHIFINCEEENQQMDLKQMEMPAIHLQTSLKTFRQFHLIGNFSSNALIIVNIKIIPLEASVKNLLPYLLNQLHELHIVFIAEQHSSSWQEELFKYSFGEGFINTLLIHNDNRSLSLYSYIPYPEIRILQLSKLDDYISRCKVHLRNLHHRPIRTFVDTVEPRKIQYVNRKGQLVHAGYIYNVFLEFIRRHNATLEFSPPMGPNGAFLKAYAMITNKELDFACYPKELTWKMPSTEPLCLLKYYVMVPHARPIASYLYFGKPFTWSMWLAVIATVVYGMIMLYICCRSERSEFGLHLLSSLCHILFISQSRYIVVNWQQFAIHCIMILCGFILTNLYLAMLSSMLTSGLFEPQLNTLQDLKHCPYRLLVDDYYVDYLKQAVSLPLAVKNRMISGTNDVLVAARIGMNTSFMYVAYEDRMEGILYQQHLLKVPRFKKIPDSFMDGLMAFPVAPSLPYLNMLNAYLRRIFECGIFAKMKSDSWMDTIDSGIYKLMRNEGVEQKPYDLEFYYFPFLLWAMGLALAGICFLLEMLMNRLTISL
ncbi:hypothetical protein KR044_005105 [Drosophila immigrans]|nr:hypothetical protein KR044_005105 [Drosophila immigrans]